MSRLERREFLAACGATLASVGMKFPITSPKADIVLGNGVIYDGSGAPPFAGDVAITGDRITEVAERISDPGADYVDLSGQALAPGFIDVHSHTDIELFVNPSAASKIRQGVTTEITGQDGGSMGPWRPESAQSFAARMRSRYGIDIAFSNVLEFFNELEKREFAVNIASMIGHGTIREFVMGSIDRPATDEELARMTDGVRGALEGGACGLSSGLEYVPGAFASPAELAALAAPLKHFGLPYASHMRNEDDQLLAAVEEALNVSRQADVPVHISHLKAQGRGNWWKMPVVLEALMEARRSGVTVTYDRYPYIAYATGLTSLFPVWSRSGGTDSLFARLSRADTSMRIEEAVRAKIEKLGSWDAVQVTSTPGDDRAWARGRRLGALGDERGVEPYALLLDLMHHGGGGMVGFGMSEENTAAFLRHPLGMICSDGSALAADGPLAAGTPHPRSFGTFPRVLGHYSRDAELMPLETAIHKMSGMPARMLRLAGRGRIQIGGFADLVVFDPQVVGDRATFERPHQYPAGIQHVLVNGQFVIRDHEATPALPGRVLRPSKS